MEALYSTRETFCKNRKNSKKHMRFLLIFCKNSHKNSYGRSEQNACLALMPTSELFPFESENARRKANFPSPRNLKKNSFCPALILTKHRKQASFYRCFVVFADCSPFLGRCGVLGRFGIFADCSGFCGQIKSARVLRTPFYICMLFVKSGISRPGRRRRS